MERESEFQMSVKNRILVVEDESDIRDLMVLHLEREGYRVEAVADGEAGLRKIGEQFDLLVLDWMLPGVSGIDLAKAVRKTDTKVPILMVTARVEPADVVLGLEAGADDYITKPFEIPVFLARVRALLRRAGLVQGHAPENNVHELEGLRIDEATYGVRCDGEAVSLTHSEFKLLVALMKNHGRVLTRQALIDLVQGSDVSVVDRTIDTHVFGLRKKLGKYGDLIETVRGVGYRVKAEI
jgi:DNA-binding response OmpR family regulator